MRNHTRTLKQRDRRKRIRRGFASIPTKSVSTPIDSGYSFQGKVVCRFSWEDQRYVVKIPKVFSLTYNADETLDVLHTIAWMRQANICRVHFDHRDCEHMGLAASLVLDVLVLRLRDHWRARHLDYRLTGKLPKNPAVNRLFRVMGMTKHLKIKGVGTDVEEEAQFTQLTLTHGRKALTLGGSDQETAPTKLVAYVDQCLKTGAGYRLNDEGKRKIVQWSGEIITNAEEHSGTSEWWTIGYMTMTKRPTPSDDAPIGECHLAIVNFGRSIAESLKAGKVSEEGISSLSELAAHHQQKRFFRTVERYSEDDLFTLYALQEGISSQNTSLGGGDRGTGTVKLITAFQKLGDTVDPDLSPEMTLISGSTRIRFTKKFPMKLRGDRMIIAFNEDNDLHQRPCPHHVHSLRGYFPGTILSFNFFIDRKHLDELKNR